MFLGGNFMIQSFQRKRNKQFWEKKGKIPLWRIAEKLNIHEKTLINWLRIELEPTKMDKVLTALKQVIEEDVAS